MLISLVFGNFSNERGCISSESAHTWSSKVRRLTCRNFEQSLIGEVRMLCFPRRTNSTANTVSHHGVHLFFTWIDKYCPRFTNTLQAWGKQTWKISFRKCLWNFCFNGCYVFFRWKARELILWTCCPKSLSKKGWNNWGAEKLHTLAWNCLATAPSELGATEKKADEMLKRQTMKC